MMSAANWITMAGTAIVWALVGWQLWFTRRSWREHLRTVAKDKQMMAESEQITQAARELHHTLSEMDHSVKLRAGFAGFVLQVLDSDSQPEEAVQALRMAAIQAGLIKPAVLQ